MYEANALPTTTSITDIYKKYSKHAQETARDLLDPMVEFVCCHRLLRNASFTNNFRWIWIGFKDLHGGLLLCFGLIRTDP